MRPSRGPDQLGTEGSGVRTEERGSGTSSRGMKPKSHRASFLSFKNRILISTLLVMIGAVVVIGAILQVSVFPRLKDDPDLIFSIKIVHLVASLLIIGISWVFIEIVSKKITLPLQELTKRADQISREVGRGQAFGPSEESDIEESQERINGLPQGDEITQLKTSFYRMLAHLRASEARLRESEEKYRFLFDNSPTPVFVLDANDLTILDMNSRAKKEYQYTREELLGKYFHDLGAADEGKESDQQLHTLVNGDFSLLPVLQHRRRDGRAFLVQLQARLTDFMDRRAIMVAVWDVTDKLEQEAKLVQTGKMATLGEMATGIAHELNNPLNVIRIGADFLLKNVKRGRSMTDEELSQTATELVGNVERAARIISHLRDFGRKPELKLVPIDVNVPIQAAFSLLGTQLKKNNIRVDLSLEEKLPLIMGGKNRLEQVFLNLITNARDAMLGLDRSADRGETAAEKVLSVKSFREGDKVVVTVSDTGPGVSKFLRSRIFEPFFTTKKRGEGTGLGLSISYGLIREHQGTIELDGKAERGATFRLTFPAIDESSETKDG